MVEYYKLDKIIEQGIDYQTPADRFYVIKKIGTNAAAATKLVIDGVETGEIISTIAPLHKTSSNLLGPLDLGDLYYVVPPDKTFSVSGPSGAKVRIIGQIGVLAPGEALPAQHASRFTEQGKRFVTYVQDTYSKATDEVWAAGEEQEVISLTPKTIEEYKFNREVLASVSGGTVSEGDFAVRFFLDGKPLDILTTGAGRLGINILSMPSPPADDTEEEAFSLADLPILVAGDHTFTIKAVNTSGASKSPASGSAWSVTVTAIVEYFMKG
ncbi:MAG: hypothetical protein ACXQTR_00930 [Candidatus Methanospirareceae archaeon]